jgi:hypothetical protein
MVPAETDYGVRMELAELSRRFTPKVLNKQIRGQRMLPTNDRTSFEYGAFEEIYPHTRFQFVYSFGGFSGGAFQTPGEGLAWIKSTDLDAFFWEVRRQDLDSNYSELEENR